MFINPPSPDANEHLLRPRWKPNKKSLNKLAPIWVKALKDREQVQGNEDGKHANALKNHKQSRGLEDGEKAQALKDSKQV